MVKDAVIRARTDSALKKEVEEILAKIGLTPSQAVNIFYSQIALHQGLPFEVKIPNKTTIQAIEETEKGEGQKFDSVEDLFKDLDD